MGKHSYKGRIAKLKNRRVIVAIEEDGTGWMLRFKRLGDRSRQEPRVVETSLTLSDEAMRYVVNMYLELGGSASLSIWYDEDADQEGENAQ